uniref:Uncharacterized protein n=1 Tax=Helianthus annuus TaxID=4232 RepID=A0A251UCE4_HELAN
MRLRLPLRYCNKIIRRAYFYLHANKKCVYRVPVCTVTNRTGIHYQETIIIFLPCIKRFKESGQSSLGICWCRKRTPEKFLRSSPISLFFHSDRNLIIGSIRVHLVYLGVFRYSNKSNLLAWRLGGTLIILVFPTRTTTI